MFILRQTYSLCSAAPSPQTKSGRETPVWPPIFSLLDFTCKPYHPIVPILFSALNRHQMLTKFFENNWAMLFELID